MAAVYPADNPLLRGAFEPIRMECDYADLVVDGQLPADLSGVLYRIGPNPQYAPIGVYNPLQGDGMIHAFYLDRGRVSYRNRWVRTRQWSLERDAGRALFSTSDPRAHDASVAGIPTEGAANTHIIGYAGRLLALEEGHQPIEIDPKTLGTAGPFDFDGQLPTNMTAHPKVDPRTGELVFFANFPQQQFDGTLVLYRADSAGRIEQIEQIQAPYPALVHDFAITEEHVVFIVCPVTLSLERLSAGGPPIAWEPHRGAFIGVTSRAALGQPTQWFPVPSCMVWHTLNAYTEGGAVHVDLCQQQAPAFPNADGRANPTESLRQFLTRWTVRLGADTSVSVRRLSDVVCEYPRIDERFAGRPYRYGYFAAEGGPGTENPLHRAIARYDHARCEMQLWHAPEEHSVSEPVFVARTSTAPEGDGYLLTVVYDPQRNASHLVVLDASAIERGPIARAYLDHRVPAGFHGSFVSG